MPLSKRELEFLAEAKLQDAKLLFDNHRHSNAYYLGGYAIELALKARIAKQMFSEVIPDKELINDTYSHNFSKLVGVAGLNFELNKRMNENDLFKQNWTIVGQWAPEARYGQTDKSIAQYFLNAVADKNCGVFEWIKSYW